ncbi:MAG: PIN domain-containing protein [Oscillospiraceae bacterium]|nr:PIN domain-containing protein [Oscillospiraceae bacterium]
MRIYLDICCFNRPYDDQAQIKIEVETKAKLFIQSLVISGRLELVWSYMLDYENSKSKFVERSRQISKWRKLAVEDIDDSIEIVKRADLLLKDGLKACDALHISCAIDSKCEFFLTVDGDILKRKIDGIIVCDPVQFLRFMEAINNDDKQ